MKRYRAAALLVLVLVLAAAAIAIPRLRPVTFHGTDLGSAAPPRDFTLEAADRGAVSLSDFRGRMVLLFFGYTACPDICPTTMARLDRVTELLGGRKTDVQVLLVTVDPELDSPERLRDYVQAFDPAFLGLSGERDEIGAIAASLGAWAGEPQPPGPAAPAAADTPHGDHAAPGAAGATGPRMIPHTSHVFGFDRAGRLRMLWSPDLTAEQIAADLRTLLR